MSADLERPDHGRQAIVSAQNIIEQTRRVVDLTRNRLDRDHLSVSVGCGWCGARATYREASQPRAFFAVHPYASGERTTLPDA